MNKVKIKGTWTLPEREATIKGELTFSEQQGIVLKPDSLFPGVLHHPTQEFEIILGTASTGEMVTLINARHYRLDDEIEYRASTMLVGCHLENIKKSIFETIAFSCDFLNEWIGVNGFSKVSWNDKGATVQYDLPKPGKFRIKNVATGQLLFKYYLDRTAGRFEANIKQSSAIKLDFETKSNFEEAVGKFVSFYKFITFACQNAPRIGLVTLYTEDLTRVDVYFKYKSYKDEKEPNRFLFNLKEVVGFDDIISRWYELEERIDASIKILFDTYLNGFLFNENTFINQCQALEVFHRRLSKIDEQLDESHNRKINSILESVDIEHRKWLEEKLAYSHEPSLRKRLKEIISKVSDTLPVKEMQIDKSFISQVVENRNYYTHYDPRSKEKILMGNDLAKLTIKLRILFIIILLKELGCHDSFIDLLYTQSRLPTF